MIATFEELADEAARRSRVCLVVAGAAQPATLEAVVAARRRAVVETAVLIDDRARLQGALQSMGESSRDYELIDADGEEAIAACAVRLAAKHPHAVLLKGSLPTDILLRAVLFGNGGLRTGRPLSDVLITTNPVAASAKIVGVTDGGVNVAPDLKKKKAIIDNAVKVFHCLGFDTPKVALLCASERVSASMPHTEEAQRLVQMNDEEEIAGCVVDGPLALDNALSEEAAQKKGIDSPVAGRADILVAPTIEAGNILGKSFRYLAASPMAHVIEGAKVPVLIPSRTESADDKFYSIALGAMRSGGEP